MLALPESVLPFPCQLLQLQLKLIVGIPTELFAIAVELLSGSLHIQSLLFLFLSLLLLEIFAHTFKQCSLGLQLLIVALLDVLHLELPLLLQVLLVANCFRTQPFLFITKFTLKDLLLLLFVLLPESLLFLPDALIE